VDATRPTVEARDAMTQQSTLLPGYRDFVPIARSGSSEIYRAQQDGLERPVAVKVLLLDDHEAVARFQREIAITVQLGRQHPHIVTVIDTGITATGRPCIVMEYYDQGSIHDRLKAYGPLPWEEVRAIGIVLADALSFAHRHGVLHRDVKPQNILVLPTSYVVADFGIARPIDAARTTSVEWFSLRHASPEALDGRPPSVADDIWSIGSTLFTLLDGRPPFSSDDDAEDTALAYMRRVRTEPPRPLLRPDVPPGLTAIIDRCLARPASHRYPDAATLHEALVAFPQAPPVLETTQSTEPGFVAVSAAAYLAGTTGPTAGGPPRWVPPPAPVALAPPIPVRAQPRRRRPFLVPAVLAALGVLACIGVVTALLATLEPFAARDQGSGALGVARTTATGTPGPSAESRPSPTAAPAALVFQGHADTVLCVAFSPDGTTVASGSADTTVRFSNPVDAAARGGPLTGHTSSVSGVAFSPDGKVLASAGSGGDERSVRLWNVAGRGSIGRLTGHLDSVYDVAFSPDGTILATASADRTVRLWNPSTRKQVANLTGHAGVVRAVAFSPDGRILASAGADGTVRLWDVRRRTAMATLRAGDEVNAVAFSPDGRTLASGGRESSVRLWDVAGRRQRGGIDIESASTGWVRSLAFSPDGRLLAAGSVDSRIRIWNAGSGELVHELTGHGNSVNDLAFVPRSGLILASAGDYTVRFWTL
jgi:WD40 repeat protein